VPSFHELPRAVLVAISKLSGEGYRDVEGTELREELARLGHKPEAVALDNLMFRLRDDGFLTWYRRGGAFGAEAFTHIRLADRGRQEVESWPTPGGLSAADFEALIAIFSERAEDLGVPEAERSKIRAAGVALRDLGTNTGGAILGAWLQQQTGIGS
jgi:hypothetical protein